MRDNDAENAIMAYLDHVSIKLKKDPAYNPHPIIKAMTIAVNEAQDDEDGNYTGISGNGDDSRDIKPTELYSVVMQKKGDTFKLLEIRDLVTGSILTSYDAILLIELSLKLEKINDDYVTVNQIKNILDEVLNGIEFEIVSPENFHMAKEYTQKILEEGKLTSYNKNILEKFKKISPTTKWSDYPPETRVLIASVWAAREHKQGISLPADKMPKDTVIKIFKFYFTGEMKDKLISNLKNINMRFFNHVLYLCL